MINLDWFDLLWIRCGLVVKTQVVQQIEIHNKSYNKSNHWRWSIRRGGVVNGSRRPVAERGACVMHVDGFTLSVNARRDTQTRATPTVLMIVLARADLRGRQPPGDVSHKPSRFGL